MKKRHPIHALRAYYQIEKFGKNGKKKTPRYKSKSFVHAFLKLLFMRMSKIDVDVIDTSNNTETLFSTAANILNINSRDGGGYYAIDSESSGSSGLGYSHSSGIVLGTDSTAVQVTDYKLWGHIIEGTDTGELEHFGQHFTSTEVSGSNAYFNVERIFRNGSGATIYIQEIGLYSLSSTLTQFCLVRDVVSPSVAVDDGEYLKVLYKIQVTA